MENNMTLKDSTPFIHKYLRQPMLVDIFGKSRQTITAWIYSDVNDLSFGVVQKFMQLEQETKSLYERFAEDQN